jgi:hypothetical protein
MNKRLAEDGAWLLQHGIVLAFMALGLAQSAIAVAYFVRQLQLRGFYGVGAVVLSVPAGLVIAYLELALAAGIVELGFRIWRHWTGRRQRDGTRSVPTTKENRP